MVAFFTADWESCFESGLLVPPSRLSFIELLYIEDAHFGGKNLEQRGVTCVACYAKLELA